MSQFKWRGHVCLARIVVCLGVVLCLLNETSQSVLNAEQWNVPPSWLNQSPAISVSSPVDGASYPAGAVIPFSAAAWDADGTIQAVAFYVDSVLYETQYSGPFEIWLPGAAPGVHTLTAIAWDNAGASSIASHTLIVDPSSPVLSFGPWNQPPLISLTAPAWGAAFDAPASITVGATASDADGTIAQVEFYANGTLIRPPRAAPSVFRGPA